MTSFRVMNVILAVLGVYLIGDILGYQVAVGLWCLAAYIRVKTPQTFQEYFNK